MEKIKAFLQWLWELKLQEHGHWCVFNCNDDDPPTYMRDAKRAACPHKGYRWDCKGIFCEGIERKNCPACEQWDRINRGNI